MEINSIVLNNSADNISVISDITDNSEIEINSVFENKIQKMNVDELKEKCNQNGIIGLSKLKKAELIQLLMNTFTNIWELLKKTKLQDLRDIYKTNNIKMLKYSTGNSKKNIIDNIMNYNSKCETLQFIKSINYNTFPKDNKPTEFNIEQPPQVKEDERIKEFGRSQKEKKQPKEKHPRPDLEAAAAAEAELKEKQRRQEAEAEAELKEKQRLQEEDEQKKKKSKIPKNVKINVWNTHIDPNIQRHKCLCCKKSIISITEFHVGHVISENAGGTLEINNLRPICASCNYSMGTTNMIDYIVKYGYYL